MIPLLLKFNLRSENGFLKASQKALKSYLLFCLILFVSVIWQSVFIYEYENRLELFFEMYASSGQNSQFGRLTEKLSPPTFFMEFF
jgi:hypothetical protein